MIKQLLIYKIWTKIKRALVKIILIPLAFLFGRNLKYLRQMIELYFIAV